MLCTAPWDLAAFFAASAFFPGFFGIVEWIVYRAQAIYWPKG
jgi:hypothetical protein